MNESQLCEWQPDAAWLFPPSPGDWLPEDHLVYFLLDVTAQIDVSPIIDNSDTGNGGPGVDYLDGRGYDNHLHPGPDMEDGTMIGGDGYDVLYRTRFISLFKESELQQFRHIDIDVDEVVFRNALVVGGQISAYFN